VDHDPAADHRSAAEQRGSPRLARLDQFEAAAKALFTPADVFFGRVAGLAANRQIALDAAYAAHPERFVRGRPLVRLPPSKVAINPIDPGAPNQTAADLLTAATSLQAAINVALTPSPAVVLPGVLSTGANVHAICS
jgi:hypothetical protein